MLSRRRSTLLMSVAITFAIAACTVADAPTSPGQRAVRAPTSANNSLLLSAPITITPLTRTTSLATPITVSKTIGVLGGTIAISQTGVTIAIPALALTSPTTISVTAMAGTNVAYEFAPHGLKFLAPVVMTQDLTKTNARSGGLVNPLSLSVGYFPDATNVASVTELLSVQVNLLSQLATTTIWHFSGYIYASGRSDDGL